MSVAIANGDLFAVALATRDRPVAVMRLLDALERQSDRDFHVLIVDQSDPPDRALAERVSASPRLHLVADDGAGLARARNLGWRHLAAHWIAFLDDDTPPERDWAARLRGELEARGELDMVSGPVTVDGAHDGDYPTLGGFAVKEPHILAGRWIRPWRVAGGIATVKRSTIERLGGWDERFGAGTADFPGSEDMDFNYRLTRSGGTVLLTPHVRVAHDQWRTTEQAVAVYAKYNRAWGGLVVKLLKTGDPLGAALFTAGRLRGIWKVARAALADRSSARLALARAELRGFLQGAATGLRRSW
jgi:GT2 family glycosyltransferase